MNGALWVVIGGLIGALVAHVLGPYLSEKFVLKAKLAESYLAPFKEWCANFHGEICEFNTRYLEKDYSHISPLQIIVDYRELHETLRFAPRWIGKIFNKKKEVAKNISELVEIVDPFWHYLENEYLDDLPAIEDGLLFEKHIKSLTENRRNEIAKKIRDHLKDKEEAYSRTQIESILDYLRKNVP